MMSFSADILPMLLQRPELYFKFIQKALLDNVLFGCGGAIRVLLEKGSQSFQVMGTAWIIQLCSFYLFIHLKSDD